MGKERCNQVRVDPGAVTDALSNSPVVQVPRPRARAKNVTISARDIVRRAYPRVRCKNAAIYSRDTSASGQNLISRQDYTHLLRATGSARANPP